MRAAQGPKAPAVLRAISEAIPPSFADFLSRPPPLKEEALRAGSCLAARCPAHPFPVAARVDASLIERNLSDGSGATLSLVHFSSPSAFWLLHIGDCMAIKARERPPPPSAASPTKRKQPDAAALEAVVLTPLHRISNPAELARVQASGGTVDDKVPFAVRPRCSPLAVRSASERSGESHSTHTHTRRHGYARGSFSVIHCVQTCAHPPLV